MQLVSSIILLFVAVATAAAPQAASTVIVHAWPLSAPSPIPYAEIEISPSPTAIQAKVLDIAQLPIFKDELVRVGIVDESNTWTGVATSAKSFRVDISKKIILHTDNEGHVAHVSFNSFENSNPADAGVFVEVMPIQPGPRPSLNKPIVLNEEGKIATPETADTKTFLQKYWWAIALFLVLQVVAGGAKEE
ncbi:hypothetical protein E2P81_ATG04473 [Venturia nashicola]|uniref:Uncharacterized protein n=1 Tax=Venturia nashicola TaxID=86259 RepID=A0A4Z1PRU6_9PEZI|nr:hypothetical protein E6O75_ATG04579 [Venturia nashicola]TLD37661.1 hypothetical protein E2P81_ATG04473 [Venturia nashicola]